jgi:hypothetical protein
MDFAFDSVVALMAVELAPATPSQPTQLRQ